LKNSEDIIKLKVEDTYITVCHYAMTIWPNSHYNSWQLFGHSHGKHKGKGKQMDIGVDTHNFYPWSFEEIKEEMSFKDDNFNKIK
jgi:calcineurin-like phosphoesterase family protein